jgi:LysM repeat protein
MFRSIAVALLFLILPNLTPAQEVDQGQRITHEVVKGETLWALSARYLGNPFRWPLIYEANASQIEDPDLIEPGQLLVIPGTGRGAAQLHEVMVVTRGEISLSEEEALPPPSGVRVQAAGGETDPALGRRTTFYTRRAGAPHVGDRALSGASGAPASVEAVTPFAVPFGLVYSAEWLEESGVEGELVGTLVGFSPSHGDRAPQRLARRGERVVIAGGKDVRLQVGDLLQSFRTVREGRKLGAVRRPTGILVVTAVDDAGTVAMVSSEFDRIQVGDRVRLAPDYAPQSGVFPLPVESNVTGIILAFPEERPIHGYGARAFLEVGMNEGVVIGDLFMAYVNQPGPSFGMEAATLQVVLVEGDRSTARVIRIKHPGLASGDRLRLIAKMQ